MPQAQRPCHQDRTPNQVHTGRSGPLVGFSNMALPIVKRGRYYYVKGTVSWGNKKLVIRQTTGRTVKSEARQVADDIYQQALNRLKGGTGAALFSTAALEWVQFKRPGITDIDNLKKISDFFRDKTVDEIRPEDWTAFCRIHLSSHKPSSVNRIRSTLNAVLRSASREIKLDKLKDNEERNVFLSVENQERLLAAYPDFIRPFFITLCYQGMRRGEALKLEWKHINFDENIIHMPGRITKSGMPRTIPMHPRVKENLQHNHPVFLFTNQSGNPYKTIEGPRKVHQTARSKVGLEYFRIHDWRHHWASRMVMVGASIKTLMDLGGWESESMVMRYTAVSDEHNRSTLNKL